MCALIKILHNAARAPDVKRPRQREKQQRHYRYFYSPTLPLGPILGRYSSYRYRTALSCAPMSQVVPDSHRPSTYMLHGQPGCNPNRNILMHPSQAIPWPSWHCWPCRPRAVVLLCSRIHVAVHHHSNKSWPPRSHPPHLSMHRRAPLGNHRQPSLLPSVPFRLEMTPPRKDPSNGATDIVSPLVDRPIEVRRRHSGAECVAADPGSGAVPTARMLPPTLTGHRSAMHLRHHHCRFVIVCFCTFPTSPTEEGTTTMMSGTCCHIFWRLLCPLVGRWPPPSRRRRHHYRFLSPIRPTTPSSSHRPPPHRRKSMPQSAGE